jgi:nitrate reductase (cytochrome), electron transfer subunit
MRGANHQAYPGEIMMGSRSLTMLLVCVICLSVVGYFVGVNHGLSKVATQRSNGLPAGASNLHSQDGGFDGNSNLQSAISYSQISSSMIRPTDGFRATMKSLPESTPYILLEEIKPSQADKDRSSLVRASRRAFNGAPPIIPHEIQNTNDAACYTCHSDGMQMASLKASVMSHHFLANCTQCHAPPPPIPFQGVDADVASTFVGLAAPIAGKRAFPGAPPTIPHSQWMRENCLACHGSGKGWAGMESTHPWRSNCTQCHGPSAVLDQAISVDSIPMFRRSTRLTVRRDR